jgi:hypothetical protein
MNPAKRVRQYLLEKCPPATVLGRDIRVLLRSLSNVAEEPKKIGGFICGAGAEWTEKSRFVRVLKLFALLGGLVVFAVTARSWMTVAEDQRKAKQYQAWMLIHAARGEGDGGRRDAITELAVGGVALAADFSKVNLRGFALTNAHFEYAVFDKADFTGATLVRCYFNDACLSGAQFVGATLEYCQFPNANLTNANFQAASLKSVDFSGADLRYATMSELNLALERKNIFKQAKIDTNAIPTNNLARWLEAISSPVRKLGDGVTH